MTGGLVDPDEPLERQNAKLLAITAALMKRVERQSGREGDAYAQFERAVLLEDQVRRRTGELERALHLLNESNARLSEANREIEEARRDLASAIEAVQEGFALFGADDVLLLFNRRFCWELPDVHRHLHPGMSFRDFVAAVGRSRHLSLPRGISAETWVGDRMRQHLARHVTFNLALRGDRWLQISEHRTANGGTAIVQMDVTDIIRAEREERDKILDNQSRIIRATLDHLNQGVAIFDAQARLVGWNQQLRLLTALPPNAYQLGTSFSRIAEHLRQGFAMSSPEEERRLAQWVTGQIPRAPLSFEITRDETIVLDGFVRELPDNGFVISFTDVTREREATRTLARANETLERRVIERTLELQEALRAAERSNASKSRFVAAVSHDLLQPLSAAKLYLASAAEDHPCAALDKAEQALQSVEEIIGALLDISRLETSESAISLSDIALPEILVPLEHAFAPIARAKGLELRVVHSSAMVCSDASYLRRILQNLISNAIRYTERGKVLVGVRRRGDRLRLEVWDTGPGIRPEDRKVIFQEFRRLNRRASASEGMGLGLAIVERACARLDHPLDLVSEWGRGSGFIVTVPDATGSGAACQARRHQPVAPPLPVQAAGLIVLLVDNDDDLRSAMVTLLEGWGVSVLDARGAQEATELLEEVGIVPDALLIDYQLDSGEDGITLAAALNTRYGVRPTQIVSANRSAELKARCADAGLGLMVKPLDTDALRHFLSAIDPPAPDAAAIAPVGR